MRLFLGDEGDKCRQHFICWSVSPFMRADNESKILMISFLAFGHYFHFSFLATRLKVSSKIFIFYKWRMDKNEKKKTKMEFSIKPIWATGSFSFWKLLFEDCFLLLNLDAFWKN